MQHGSPYISKFNMKGYNIEKIYNHCKLHIYMLESSCFKHVSRCKPS